MPNLQMPDIGPDDAPAEPDRLEGQPPWVQTIGGRLVWFRSGPLAASTSVYDGRSRWLDGDDLLYWTGTEVASLDAASGQLRRPFEWPQSTIKPAWVADGLILVNSRGAIYAYDHRAREEHWKWVHERRLRHGAFGKYHRISAGLVAARCASGVHCLDAATGEELWFTPALPAWRPRVGFVASAAHVALHDGQEQVVVVDRATGDEVLRVCETHDFAEFTVAAALDVNERLWTSTYRGTEVRDLDGHVVASVDKGDPGPTGEGLRPLADGAMLVSGRSTGVVEANGQVRWWGGRDCEMSDGGSLVGGSPGPSFSVVDLATGLSTPKVTGPNPSVAEATGDGIIVVLTGDGICGVNARVPAWPRPSMPTRPAANARAFAISPLLAWSSVEAFGTALPDGLGVVTATDLDSPEELSLVRARSLADGHLIWESKRPAVEYSGVQDGMLRLTDYAEGFELLDPQTGQVVAIGAPGRDEADASGDGRRDELALGEVMVRVGWEGRVEGKVAGYVNGKRAWIVDPGISDPWELRQAGAGFVVVGYRGGFSVFVPAPSTSN